MSKKGHKPASFSDHAYLVTRLEDNPEFISDRLLIIDEVKSFVGFRKSTRGPRYPVYYRFA